MYWMAMHSCHTTEWREFWSAHPQITTRELCPELNIIFNALETIMASLEYHKLCAKWVLWMLAHEQEEHCEVYQYLLNQYKTEGDNFLDCIITSDKTWRHHHVPESKWWSMEWQHVNSPAKKKFQMKPSMGKVMCTVFWDRKTSLGSPTKISMVCK